VRGRIKFKGLKFHISEPEAVIDKIQNCGVIGGIKNRPSQLDLYCSVEFISRDLVIDVDENIAVDSFRIAENMVCPDCIVHEFINIALHVLKNGAV
jgi:hypothetical protein